MCSSDILLSTKQYLASGLPQYVGQSIGEPVASAYVLRQPYAMALYFRVEGQEGSEVGEGQKKCQVLARRT